jgi:probable nitrogen fixation protein
MTQSDLVVQADDPYLTSEIVTELLKQLRALDMYDTYEGWPVEKIIDPVVLTKERKREIPIVGDPDEITLARVKAYYNSLATLIEKRTQLLAVPVINISHEGFGRAFVLVGKLIVVDKILRDVHRWGFPSLEDLATKSDEALDKAVALIEKFREVAEG